MIELTYTTIACKMLSNTNRENILKKLEKEEGLRFNDINFALKLNNNTLSYHIKKLLESKMVRKDQNEYYITEFGRRALEFMKELYALVENHLEGER